MKKIFLISLGFILSSLPASSQDSFAIGQPIRQDLKLLIGPPNNRPTIVDLFSSSCTVCFSMMPKVNELQAVYNSNLDFLLVGDEDGIIQKIYSKFEHKLNLKLKVRYDSAFFRNNDLSFVPTYLWVDKNQILRGVSSPTELTKENIDRFINTGTFKQPEQYPDFDPFKPFLKNGNGGNGQDFLIRTILTDWNSQIGYSSPKAVKNRISDTSFQALGQTMKNLYQYAYIGEAGWYYGDSLYGKINPEVYIDGGQVGEEKEKQYCYSVYKSARSPVSMPEILKQDLRRSFGFDVSWELKPVVCWKLTADSRAISLKSKVAVTKVDCSMIHLELRHATIDDLLREFFQYHQMIFINATNINSPIDLELDLFMSDIESVKKALATKGLLLTPAIIKLPTLVLMSTNK